MSNDIEIIYYTKEKCQLCQQGKEILDILCEKYHMRYQEIDIYSDDALLEEYQLMIPVVKLNGDIVQSGKMSIAKLDRLIREKRDASSLD